METGGMSSAIRRTGHVAVAALLFAVAGPVTAPAAAQDSTSNGSAAPRSTLTGAFTLDQAAQGEALFVSHCASCHPTSQFTGSSFQRAWSGRPVFALFDQLRLMMPMDNPGGLRSDEYAAVIAYMLKLNAYPAADTPLPSDDDGLKQIQFERQPASNR
jgi:mono/diheme cytochrome c family protein